MANLGIVVSEFNKEITSKMEEHALHYAKKSGAKVVRTIHVYGAFDMPLAVKKLLEQKNVDAVVTLGAIIKGETRHDELIAYTVANALTRLSLQFNKPVTLGISGPGVSWELAEARVDDYAKRAVLAAIGLVKELKKK